MKKLLTEGVGLDKEQRKYTITSVKSKDDLITLQYSPIRNVVDIDNIPVFYGFKLEARDPSYDKFKRTFIQNFKTASSTIPVQSYVMLLKQAVALLNYNLKLSSIDVIVYPKSSSRINKELAEFIAQKSGNCLVIPDTFLKESIYDVEIDMDKINNMASSQEEREKILENLYKMFERNHKAFGDEFKMKIFYPYQRQLIKNFLRLRDDVGQRTLTKIRTGTVLFIDDVITSGTTLVEMNHILRNLGARRIYGFALLKN
jgi:hypothetical protein